MAAILTDVVVYPNGITLAACPTRSRTCCPPPARTTGRCAPLRASG